MKHKWIIISSRETKKLLEMPTTVPHCKQKVPNDLSWDLNLALVVWNEYTFKI
jgi:hypothetical protein